ncbi:MAG: hypothetical protein LBR91_00780 [Puniceicoccales bacterium]|jgi:hypothetical protein|nr:hypothetical protein [Puniceicoccales bacterium]
MDVRGSIGVGIDCENISPSGVEIDRIKLQLMLLGHRVGDLSGYVSEVVAPVVAQVKFGGICKEGRCKADARIENFCKNYLGDVGECFLPENDFICNEYGVARVLSLPEKSDEFHSEYVDSYRTYNGVLHNPSTDKRTTKDVFHIVEGGLPVPSDKKEVPKIAFARMLWLAFHPNGEILTLPFTSEQSEPVKTFVSNYIKPVICPKMEGIQPEKRMEIRFFVPGSLVSILDCVESIFGNAGSPTLPENDAALDPMTWSGHTGCIVFAPQLRKCTKKFLGLPHVSVATDRQKRDGMCWESEDELYHGGKLFKIMARDGGGVVISIVADSYNGYGKKEIKTQMSYAANMLGMCEEEHSGGTFVFPRYDLGDEFNHSKKFADLHTFENIERCCQISLDAGGDFVTDKVFPNIIYVPEYANFCLPRLTISWERNGDVIELPFELGKVYILPSGYRINLEKPDSKEGRWKMIGTVPNGVFCYKPATVSGGGKSEIAKPIDEFISSGPTIVHNYADDCRLAEEILRKDFSKRFSDVTAVDDRKLLDSARSLGSVIKLLTPSDDYNDGYNGWLRTIPQHVLELIFAIKRFSKDFADGEWQKFFTVDKINGHYGNELRYNGDKMFEYYLRIGFGREKHRRLFSLRDDFIPSIKLQLADDITAAAVVPSKNIQYLSDDCENMSVKIIHNCEYRLYQRPDEAIVPGYDPGSERDMTLKNVFTCNFKALTRDDVKKMMRNRMVFEMYSSHMKKMLEAFVGDEGAPKYIVCPSELRTMPDGSISKNQRYLQNRGDICDEFNTYLANISCKLWRKFGGDFDATSVPVQAILSGRRNNPPTDGIRPLCVYGPLHYMDIPELFLEFISSMTGKSPSTTGAGLEGAMTKGPFSCVSSVYDLNSALLSFILTDYAGFLSAAGYVGPHFRVDHDITYLLPEIWSRMTTTERKPEFLISHGYLERCENFQYRGEIVHAERLGYRITKKFVREFSGRVFSSPNDVFSEEMLRPETQDMEIFVDSMDTIVDAHRRAAALIVDSAEIEEAIPPLRALLNIAVNGEYNGMTLRDEAFRSMFTRECVIKSDWYIARLRKFQKSQIEYLANGIAYVADAKNFYGKDCSIDFDSRETATKVKLEFVKTDVYIDSLIGTLGK